MSRGRRKPAGAGMAAGLAASADMGALIAAVVGRGSIARAAQAAALPPLTPWYHPDTRPVRAGVYERQYEDGRTTAYARWTGEHWMFRCRTPAEAAREVSRSYVGGRPWRGLAAPPATTKPTTKGKQ